jgi:hypothetical protein
MSHPNPSQFNGGAGPVCNRCGGQTRLFGIEPHPTVERTDLRTHVCETCAGVQTEIVPLAR